ncbi:MAG: hypothetical protein LDL13_01630 [Calditerrivibrio sp.]|nr:hypothetical protein [Calditerrivibrio sp.]MCA1932264.1 hypothetical protein [Calditerrivibrio sp.]
MKKRYFYFYILIFIFLVILATIIIVRDHFINIGEKKFYEFSKIKPFESKSFIFNDRYGETFFEKQVYFGGEILPEDVDDYIDIYLKNRCKRDLRDEKIYKLTFLLVDEDIDSFYLGCVDAETRNKFELYGIFKYIVSKVDKNKIASLILNKIEINKAIKGIEGLSTYYFNRVYRELNNNEKLYIFYIMDNISRLNGKMEGFSQFKKDIFSIETDEPLKFSDNKKISIDKYPNISRMILRELEEFGADKLDNFNIVNTSFDPAIYEKVIEVLEKYFEKRDKALQTAGIVLNYQSGEVLTAFGSKNDKSRLNRVLDIKRQVGSIFKPIVYLTAFENGISRYDKIEDKPTVYGRGPKAYAPKNFENFFMGTTKVENALIYSLNNGTLQVALKAGIQKVAEMADKLGMKTPVGLGYCLGAGEYRVIDVANYFSVIANDGIKKRNGLILSIKNDNETFDFKTYYADEQVVSYESAKTVKEILGKVVKIGTARGAGLLNGTAGKTGTTNDSRDAWFASIYDKYVIVVWVGRDDYKPMADNGTGGGVAAPIVARIQRILN